MTVQPDPSDVGAEPNRATSPLPLEYPPPVAFWPASQVAVNEPALFPPTLAPADFTVTSPAAELAGPGT